MRGVVTLAVRTGIPVDVWIDGDQRDIYTALEVLEESDRAARRK